MKHVYEIRPRKDKRGFDLISDTLPFGRFETHEYKGDFQRVLNFLDSVSRARDKPVPL